MRSLIGLAVCLALVLALSGCKKSDSDASSKKGSGSSGGSPSGPPPGSGGGPPGGGRPGGPPAGYPGRGPGPSSDSGDAPGTPQAQPEVMLEPEEPDDHSDDPWFDHEAATTPAAEADKKPAAEGEKKPSGSASTWEPDKALVDQLEPYQDVDAYQIRPPKGYRFMPLHTPDQKGFLWTGPLRADTSAPELTAVITTSPFPGEAMALSLESFVERWLAKGKKVFPNWQQTPAERGQVNGLTFLRVKWQWPTEYINTKSWGREYFAQDGAKFIRITIHDMAPDDQALPLGEAAALTFRKK